MDSRPLPVNSKLPVSLANVFFSNFAVSPNLEHVWPDGAVLRGSPLSVFDVASTELLPTYEIDSRPLLVKWRPAAFMASVCPRGRGVAAGPALEVHPARVG